jgi:protein-tyrosine kinase
LEICELVWHGAERGEVSNIFGALRKGSTFDFDEVQSDDVSPAKELHAQPSPDNVHAMPLAAAPRTPPVFYRSGARSVDLRICALSPVLPFDNGHDLASEQYQIIRTKILHHATKPQLILVSSASSGDGKTVTSINLAAALALQSDACVLLLDGDLRRPSVADALGIDRAPGLGDVLAGRIDLECALVQTAQFPNLFVLPAGYGEERAADLLDSPSWRTLVTHLRGRFSNIICDAPPIATVADYELLQLVCDATIMVARPDHTDRAACKKALASIEQGKLLGVVLNCVEDWWLWKTPSYSYYRSNSSRALTDVELREKWESRGDVPKS